MIGYIHIAASGDRQEKTAEIRIDNVSATAYNSVLAPIRIDTLEGFSSSHDCRRSYSHYGNLGALRVLPVEVPTYDRRHLKRLDPTNLDLLGSNNTYFTGDFKYRSLTFTLSPFVDINPVRYAKHKYENLEKAVTINFFKYSERMEAFQQVELVSSIDRLRFIADIAHEHEHKELDYDAWQASFAANAVPVSVVERYVPMNAAEHVEKITYQHGDDFREEDIVEAFEIKDPFIDLTSQEDQ